MTLEELTPEFIFAEIAKLQYLYKLKQEIRYAQRRGEKDLTESVAEHVYGMHICALYFLPLEDTEQQWDRARIYEMISLHDIDEVETGDMLGYKKTDAIRAAEANAMRTVMERSPLHMQFDMRSAIDEYEAQTSKEAQFVKAIDRFEPLVQMFNEYGKETFLTNQTTSDDAVRIKEKYIVTFPFMYRFYKVVHEAMDNQGFFYRA